MSTLCPAHNCEEPTNLKPRKELPGNYPPPLPRSCKKGVLCDMQIMTPAIYEILLQILDGNFTFMVPMNVPPFHSLQDGVVEPNLQM
jgi:hypothetical protein